VRGQTAVERRLTSGVLAFAGHDDVAHDALVDNGGVDARAADRFAHDERAERGAVRSLRAPRNLPVGVRTALTITAALNCELSTLKSEI
jgi:hypothetical protein